MLYDDLASTGPVRMPRAGEPPAHSSPRAWPARSPSRPRRSSGIPAGATRCIPRPLAERKEQSSPRGRRSAGMVQDRSSGRMSRGTHSAHTSTCRFCVPTHALRTSGVHFRGHLNPSWGEVLGASTRQGWKFPGEATYSSLRRTGGMILALFMRHSTHDGMMTHLHPDRRRTPRGVPRLVDNDRGSGPSGRALASERTATRGSRQRIGGQPRIGDEGESPCRTGSGSGSRGGCAGY